MSAAQITIDLDVCVGIGVCELLHPERITVDADQHARARSTTVPIEVARALRDGCPSGAIAVVGDD